jgi:hypothetical protein
MTKIQEDQSFLVARDFWGGINHVLAARGGWANHYAGEASDDLANVLAFDADDGPNSPGLWVWTGTATPMERTLRDKVHDQWRWYVEGTWRPCVIADFAHFGLSTPTPRVPEGATP